MTTISLFERLGRTQGINSIVKSVINRHLANPLIAKRFHAIASDSQRLAQVSQHVSNFLEAGSGGPGQYTGKSMEDAHRGMNISAEEYLTVCDDIMAALSEHSMDEATQKDVLFIAYSLKPQIMRK